LATKKAQYLDRTQFYAQYYNNPNIGEESGIDRSRFQYYDRTKIRLSNGLVSFDGRRLNVFASIDFAFSLSKSSDYTAIVVIGISESGDIYILDIDRFRTDKISEYFHRLRALHVKWNFRRLRAEVTVAQAAIVREIKEQYFKPYAMNISIDEHRPSRHEGSKEERIKAVLSGRYDNQVIWHYQGGFMQSLEDELIQAHPAHDDIKDALASAVDIAVPPRNAIAKNQEFNFNSRFGGMGTR
jgi:phage terminase large subunit-like protein